MKRFMIFSIMAMLLVACSDGWWRSPILDEDGLLIERCDGATLTFDSDHHWLNIDGNGEPIPDTLLSSRLPEPLFDYIVAMAATHDIYRVSNNYRTIKVESDDTYIDYDIFTGVISYPAGLKSHR